jgi:hypothetical protein
MEACSGWREVLYLRARENVLAEEATTWLLVDSDDLETSFRKGERRAVRRAKTAARRIETISQETEDDGDRRRGGGRRRGGSKDNMDQIVVDTFMAEIRVTCISEPPGDIHAYTAGSLVAYREGSA